MADVDRFAASAPNWQLCRIVAGAESGRLKTALGWPICAKPVVGGFWHGGRGTRLAVPRLVANKTASSISASSSRREFMAAGAGAMVSGLLTSVATGAATRATPVAAPPAPPLPWAYAELDVDLVRRRGYEAYFKYSCCYAAASALLTTLRETSGGPWATIPPEMFRFGAGGGLGWGTMCGALNACLAVLNLASPRFEELGNELVGWYTVTPFPSARHDAYAAVKQQPTTVSHSPLCHLSVGTWVNSVGVRIHEKDRKDRCAKLTGDTAAMAATLLNQALADKVVPTYKPARAFSHCLDCHQGPTSLRDDAQGKANCLQCHDEHPRQH